MNFFLSLLCFALSFLSLSCTQAPERPSSPLIKVGILKTPDNLPLLVAKEQKFFEDSGLDVELIAFQSAMERDSAFQAGEIQGISCDIISAALMCNQEIPLKVVALTIDDGNEMGRVAILSSPHSPLQDLKEIQGKQLALSSNTVVEYIADQLLLQNYILPSSVEKVKIPKIFLRLSMLLEDKVECAILPDPFASYAEKHGATALIDDQGQNLGQAVLAFDETYMKSHLESMRRFMEAFSQAVSQVNENTEAYSSLLKQLTHLPDDVEVDYQVKRYPLNQVPTKKQVGQVLGWLASKGLLSEPLTYDDIVSDAYLPSHDTL